MEVPDHNGVGYSGVPQGDAYRSRGQLQRHHTIQTCDDAYVSETQQCAMPSGWQEQAHISVACEYWRV